jgi:hypothetical protein
MRPLGKIHIPANGSIARFTKSTSSFSLTTIAFITGSGKSD